MLISKWLYEQVNWTDIKVGTPLALLAAPTPLSLAEWQEVFTLQGLTIRIRPALPPMPRQGSPRPSPPFFLWTLLLPSTWQCSAFPTTRSPTLVSFTPNCSWSQAELHLVRWALSGMGWPQDAYIGPIGGRLMPGFLQPQFSGTSLKTSSSNSQVIYNRKKKDTPIHIQQAVSKPSKPHLIEHSCLCATTRCHTVPMTQILMVLHSRVVISQLFLRF